MITIYQQGLGLAWGRDVVCQPSLPLLVVGVGSGNVDLGLAHVFRPRPLGSESQTGAKGFPLKVSCRQQLEICTPGSTLSS